MLAWLTSLFASALHLADSKRMSDQVGLTDNHQLKLFCRASAESAHGFGSGAGIRTLNLAVNRSLHHVQK
jgi:hypothetical protein